MSSRCVSIRPWAEGDAALLHRLLGEEDMTQHIGGPETFEQIEARHRRYLSEPPGRLFAIALDGDADPIGWVGYWEAEWQGETVWETGWHVLPEFQGMGVATSATVAVLERVAAEGIHRTVHAFPSVSNHASNAVCRKAGFVCRGEVDVEYPKGRPMRSNDWCASLPMTRCPECGARLSWGRSCMDNFYELLALEADVPGAPGELPHFYAVAAYGLQHPAAMGFTVSTVEGLRESVRMALEDRADTAHLRSRARDLSASQGRVTRRGDEPVPAWPVPEWDYCVVDVLAGGAGQYADRVRCWAASITAQTDALSPRP